jgi:diaminohydroxyphosphoribosylaminopyrimidine deaminase/5-amino-6-(5-phosphoribosylamino)uracil reductase
MTEAVSHAELDARFMARALTLAERGRGGTSPNPMVGAVIVRDGAVVGEGWHRRAGGPHAEIEALAAAGAAARGGTAYVTLEPCCHTGRTGPCTEALVAAGVTRVVAGQRDPNPRVDGGGFAALSAAGVSCEAGVLEAACADLNRAFERWITTGLPWVVLKLALSLDGRLARRPGPGHAVTGPEAHAAVQALRAASDAVVVGSETALADDPRLTLRGEFPGARPPLRVVFDSRLKVSRSARLYAPDAAGGRPVAVCALPADHPRVREVTAAGVLVLSAPETEPARAPEPAGGPVARALGHDAVPGARLPSRVAIPAALRLLGQLAETPVTSLLLEGGGGLAASFLAAGLVDEVVTHVAPEFYGAEGVAACAPLPLSGRAFPGARFRRASVRPLGDDLEVIYRRDVTT